MRPLSPDNVRWLPPRDADPGTFRQRIVPALVNLLSRSKGDAVYDINTRSIYRSTDPLLGPVAIKELRFETTASRLRATTIRRHRILCEYRAQSAFAARGGDTPRPHGAALESAGPLLTRVLIVMAWVDDARTLSEAVRTWSDGEREAAFEVLARRLVSAAELGLVHGRHSSENILVAGDPPRFHVIDFSHAQIFPRFEPLGFSRDVARIGARLIVEQACSRAAVQNLFAEVARAAPAGSVSPVSIEREFDAVLQLSKQHQRRLRRRRTRWRGWPFRLG